MHSILRYWHLDALGSCIGRASLGRERPYCDCLEFQVAKDLSELPIQIYIVLMPGEVGARAAAVCLGVQGALGHFLFSSFIFCPFQPVPSRLSTPCLVTPPQVPMPSTPGLWSLSLTWKTCPHPRRRATVNFLLAPIPTWPFSAQILQSYQLHLCLVAPSGSPCSGFHFLSLPSFLSNL